MFFGRLLNAGYSGASNHSSVNSPLSIRLTVAPQNPSNSRFSFQYAARTLAPTRSVSQGLGAAAVMVSGLLADAATGLAALVGLVSGEAGEAVAGLGAVGVRPDLASGANEGAAAGAEGVAAV